MATPIPFDCFALDLGKKIHNLSTDTLKVYLTNTAPNVAAHAVYADLADLATAGGYTAGGQSIGANTWSQTGGVAALAPGADLTFTATTGFGPFRYAVLYNFTAANKNLICYWDNGAAVTVAAGANFTVDFGAKVLELEF